MTNWTDCGIPFSEAEDGAGVLWGPRPAEKIAEGKQSLIARLYRELDHHPSAAQVDDASTDRVPAETHLALVGDVAAESDSVGVAGKSLEVPLGQSVPGERVVDHCGQSGPCDRRTSASGWWVSRRRPPIRTL